MCHHASLNTIPILNNFHAKHALSVLQQWQPPLSLSASIIAVLSASISVAKTLNTLIQGYREAPIAITALSNEVSDLVLVLSEIKNRSLDGVSNGLRMVLGRADHKLGEVKTFVDGLGVIGTVDGRRGQGRRNERLNLRKSCRRLRVIWCFLMSSGILRVPWLLLGLELVLMCPQNDCEEYRHGYGQHHLRASGYGDERLCSSR
jgi:hypothetical protein